MVIDPTEAKPVQDYCQLHQLKLAQIWLTHWHKDHIGGVPDLIEGTQIPVFGPREELSKIHLISNALQHDDQFKFHDLHVEVVATPGHTLGILSILLKHYAVYFAVIPCLRWAVDVYLKAPLNRCIIHLTD